MHKKFRLGSNSCPYDLESFRLIKKENRLNKQKRRHEIACSILPDTPTLSELESKLWLDLPEARLIWRHSNLIDLELNSGSIIHASLAGKLKGTKLVVGDRVRYKLSNKSSSLCGQPQAQVVAVMPRETLLKRGGIDDREPWQLICANIDELWLCVSLLEPKFRLGFIDRVYAIALAANLKLRIIITKFDQEVNDNYELSAIKLLQTNGLDIYKTSVIANYGLNELHKYINNKKVVLMGHSGVGKSSLINALLPDSKQKVGSISRYGTGRQTTTGAHWFSYGYGAIVDTAGIRNLSVRGLPRLLLGQIFSDLPDEFIQNPLNISNNTSWDDIYIERLLSLQRLWIEMEERNPNQNIYR